MHQTSPRAFSLIETAVAIGIIASVLLALVALIPLATNQGNEAAAKTAVGALLEDLQERVEGTPLDETNGTPLVFYYDEGGDFVDSAAANFSPLQRRYRAEVHLVKPSTQWYQADDSKTTALAMKVGIFWPIEPSSGDPVGAADPVTGLVPPKSRVTYFVNTLTGRDWTDIDPDGYEPKVEF